MLDVVNRRRRPDKNQKNKKGVLDTDCIENLYAWLSELAPEIRNFEVALASRSRTLQEMLSLHLALVEKLSGPIEFNGETRETNNQILEIIIKSFS